MWPARYSRGNPLFRRIPRDRSARGCLGSEVPGDCPALQHASDRSQLHRFIGYPPAVGYHLPTAAKSPARRCSLHFPFRCYLRHSHRLGAWAGVWPFAPDQLGQPMRRQRNRCIGAHDRRPVYAGAYSIPGKRQQRPAFRRRSLPCSPEKTGYRPKSWPVQQR